MEWLAMQTAAETTGELTEREIAALSVGGVFGAFAGAFAMALLVWYVLMAIAYWKIFAKAGRPGWHALIPFLNVYDQYDMVWNGWIGVCYALLTGFGASLGQNAEGVMVWIACLLSLAGFVIGVFGKIKFAKAFGKGTGFTVGLVLLEPVFMLILGFGKSEYIGKPKE